MRAWIAKVWCFWTHGGEIVRDDQGRINWRCRKCGRWSDYPVSHEEERKVVERETLRHFRGQRNRA